MVEIGTVSEVENASIRSIEKSSVCFSHSFHSFLRREACAGSVSVPRRVIAISVCGIKNTHAFCSILSCFHFIVIRVIIVINFRTFMHLAPPPSLVLAYHHPST